MGYLAKLGPVSFVFRSFEFDDYERETSWDWQTVSVLNKPPRYHFGGKGIDSLSLRALLFPDANTDQRAKLEEIRILGNKGEPLDFVYASEREGQYMGKWVIKSVSDKRSVFNKDGSPGKLEFTIKIEKYPED